jgi:hypothetical protein
VRGDTGGWYVPLMEKTRYLAPYVALVLLLVGCGGGGGGNSVTTSGDDPGETTVGDSGEDSGNENEGSTDSGSGGVDVGNNGSIQFEISGNWDDEGEWPFIPAASTYVNEIWSMSFAPKIDGTGDGILTLMLDGENFFMTYGTAAGVITGGSDLCEIDIDRADAGGTAGNFECTNLFVLPTEGSMTDGVNFSARFETNS